jgi:hypothetical protein
LRWGLSVLTISTFQVAGVTGLNHLAWFIPHFEEAPNLSNHESLGPSGEAALLSFASDESMIDLLFTFKSLWKYLLSDRLGIDYFFSSFSSVIFLGTTFNAELTIWFW